MSLMIASDPVPLKMDQDGAIRVGQTRVTLDTIIGYYKQGMTAEELADAFSTVSLPDIHATIAYYLRHRLEVEAYLAEGKRQAEEIRKVWDARIDRTAIRERLLARRAAMKADADAATSHG